MDRCDRTRVSERVFVRTGLWSFVLAPGRRLALPVVAIGWLSGSVQGLAAQSVAGRVLEDGTLQPVPFASAALVDSADNVVASVVADSLGSFFLRADPGSYRLRAQRIGYATATSEPILLRRDEPVIVELRLSVSGVPLEPLIVRARGMERGEDAFRRRRDLGAGVFLDPDSVALRRPRFAWHAFRGVEGIMMKETFTGARIYSFSGGRCMAIYVDHNPRPYAWDTPSSGASGLFRGRAPNVGPFDSRLALGGGALSHIVGESIRGVEVYRDFWEIPEELKTAQRIKDLWRDNAPMPCGMAIIWTSVAW